MILVVDQYYSCKGLPRASGGCTFYIPIVDMVHRDYPARAGVYLDYSINRTRSSRLPRASGGVPLHLTEELLPKLITPRERGVYLTTPLSHRYSFGLPRASGGVPSGGNES